MQLENSVQTNVVRINIFTVGGFRESVLSVEVLSEEDCLGLLDYISWRRRNMQFVIDSLHNPAPQIRNEIRCMDELMLHVNNRLHDLARR